MAPFKLAAIAFAAAFAIAGTVDIADARGRDGRGGGGGFRGGGGAPSMGRAAPSFARPAAPAMRSFSRPSFSGHSFSRPSFAERPSRPSFTERPSFSRPSFARPSFAYNQRMRPGGEPRLSRRGDTRMASPAWRERRALAGRSFDSRNLRTPRTFNGRTFAARQNGARLSPRELRQQRAIDRGDARIGRFGGGRYAGFAPQRGVGIGPRTVGTAFAARQAANAGWYNNWRRHKRIAFGWYGPLFWPYAYDSIFNNVFWPYAYDYDPFWDYGYGDIYSALFYPYTYDEVIDVPPPPGGVRTVTGSVPPRPGPVGRAIRRVAPLCGDDAREIAGVPIDTIQDAVGPNETQRALLDELGNASIKAAQVVKAACPNDIAMTPTGRLAAMKARIEAMIEAVATVREPLENFYHSLTDEQKARFDAIGQRTDQAASRNALTDKCSIGEATEWPTAQIERTVRPTAEQRDALDALKRASDGAAELLKSSCPTELPITPSARFAAVSARLTAMLDAVKTVSGPLEAFYGTLNNEQKAQFNQIGRQRAIRQG